MVWLYNCFYKNSLIFFKLTQSGGRVLSLFFWTLVFFILFGFINLFSNFLGFLPTIVNEFVLNLTSLVPSQNSNVFSLEFINEAIVLVTVFIKQFYLVSIDSTFSNINFFFTNYLDYPVFLYFGLFFFFTTFMSLIVLSYLGLYGVFCLNLISLTMLWLSIIPYALNIFSNNLYYYVSFGKWMYLTINYKVSFDFLIDITSISFSFLTLTIAQFVYIYTFAYFRYEPLVDRLVLFLNMFIISMVFLVSSGNLINLFLGWEMIGLTSFFLINFWSARVGTLKAAFKAYSFNKTSDLFLFVVIVLLFNTLFTLDIPTILNQIHLYENYTITIFNVTYNYIELICVLFLICAFIKSAQFGAHIWLPDSMEAPVPASALIHSATLVSAGIYLLLRFTPMFELSEYSLSIIAIIGSVTAFYGGFTSMFQSDAKRILAYSTISHCGFLMVIYSTGVIEYTILYLYVHGFFKAATFLCVGNIIRFSRNTQDFKRMGGYAKFLPADAILTFVCMMNLSGLPLTFGFFIKHFLFVGLRLNLFLYYFVLINCLFGALTGLFYGYRLYYSIFFDIKKARKSIYTAASKNDLKSKFYTNTTKAATLAIITLVFVSYTMSVFLLNLFLSKNYFYSDFSNYYFSILLFDLYWSTNNFLLNNSFLNWVVLVLGVMIVYTYWRVTILKSMYLHNFNFFIISLSVFFLTYTYL